MTHNQFLLVFFFCRNHKIPTQLLKKFLYQKDVFFENNLYSLIHLQKNKIFQLRLDVLRCCSFLCFYACFLNAKVEKLLHKTSKITQQIYMKYIRFFGSAGVTGEIGRAH